jgi:hypothetical protein
MKKFLFLVALAVLLGAACGQTQTKSVPSTNTASIPQGARKQRPVPNYRPFGASNGNLRGLSTDPSSNCKPEDIPTLDSLNSASFQDSASVMTVAEALDAKVNFFGSHSGSYSGSDLVFVDDYMVAGAPCTALDGKTQLLYGQAARITFVMKSFKAAGSVNFAVVAANASVSGESNAIEVDSLGLPASVKLALEDVKTTASGGLDVKNYTDFNNKVVIADKAAITDGPKGTVFLIGKVFPDNAMTVAVARVFAMVSIRDTGEGCETAISKYPNITPEIETTIRDTYNSVTGGCGTNEDGINKAKAFLQPLKIKAD